jgi:hypothetical protein
LGSESKELLMTMKNRIGCMTIAVLLCGAAPALAKTTRSTPEDVPLQKTIGQASPDIVPSLIVLNARGASPQGGKLTLIGVSPNSIVFADGPVRAAGHTLTTHLLEERAPYNESDESFTKDPPNGTVSEFSADGSKIRDAVVVLKTAKLEGDKPTFDMDVLEGELTGGDGPAALFIDRFGFGRFHAGGFHAGGFGGFHGGYARVGTVASASGTIPTSLAAPGIAELRSVRLRSGGAALGAAAAGAYPGYGAACGYYPYPPCY